MNTSHAGEERERVVHVALCPPATRTVVVRSEAYQDEENDRWHTGSEVYPVLALKVVVFRRYHNDTPGEPFWDDEELLHRHGWRPLSERQETYLVGYNHNGPGMGQWQGFECGAGCNGFRFGTCETDYGVEIVTAVVCDWPPEQDHEQLAEVVKDLERQALDRAKCRSEQEVARAVVGRVPAE
jgi:hypothetical protein